MKRAPRSARARPCSRIVAGDLKAGDLDQQWNGLRRARRASAASAAIPDRIEEAVRPAPAPGTATSSCTSSRAARSNGDACRSASSKASSPSIATTWSSTGMANHAGTTPMDGRQDALVAASRLVLAVREIADGAPGPAGGHGRPSGGRAQLAERRPRPGDAQRGVPRPRRATLDALGDGDPRAGRGDRRVRRARPSTLTLAHHNPPALADAGVQDAIGQAADAPRSGHAAAAQRRRPRRADDRRPVPDGHDLRAEHRRDQPLAARAHDLGRLRPRRAGAARRRARPRRPRQRLGPSGYLTAAVSASSSSLSRCRSGRGVVAPRLVDRRHPLRHAAEVARRRPPCISTRAGVLQHQLTEPLVEEPPGLGLGRPRQSAR